jgi:2-dehydro-3-deoxyphosphogluconate aldolase/(4S)-4-hydroxy-2-oxoglutarate aldolase
MTSRSLREVVVEATKSAGVLPCIKLPERADWLAYAQAMHDGGARVVEITMTTPGALEAIEAIASHFKDKLLVAAGTVLDAATARSVIAHGGSLIVSPTVRPDVIAAANEHGVPMFSGAFSATECQLAMESGAAMVKVFPAHVGGPAYMANLKMVFPEIDLIPSGGITLENAGEYIRQGACAVSGARTFMDLQKIEREGLGWLTQRVAAFIEVVKRAKAEKAAKARR